MRYKTIGHSDLHVSEICLGTMTWGEQNDKSEAFAQMDLAVERGVNFFDTAEMYPIPQRASTQGLTETYIGDWLRERGRRDALVIATKVTGRAEKNPDLAHIRQGPRLSESHIRLALEQSLQRLQTDYIDLYQVHWPERSTNFFGKLGYRHSEELGIEIEETLRTLAALVKEGKIRYLGISNETAWGLHRYIELHKLEKLPLIVSIQNPYSLLNRTYEISCAEFTMQEKVSLLPYSPLAFGKLSGKYLNGAKPPGARLTLYDGFPRYSKTNADEAVQAYVDCAKRHGLDPSQMALAFVNTREFVASNIIGATTLEQLRCNLASVDLVLSDDVLQDIEQIHQRFPNPSP